MKKFILSLGLVLALVGSAYAESAVASIPGGSTTNLVLTGPAKINSISVSSLATTNGVLAFYDSAFNTNTYSAHGFTNLSYTVFSTNVYYTNIFGKINTNTYTVKAITTNTVAAAIIARPLIASITSVSNSVVTYDFDGAFVGTGLLITNPVTVGGLGGITVTVSYDKMR